MNKRITLLVLSLFILNSNYTSASGFEDNNAWMLQYNVGYGNFISLYRNIRDQINRVAMACNANDNVILDHKENILDSLEMIVNNILNNNIDDNTINDLNNIRDTVGELRNYCLDNYNNYIIINTFSQLARDNINRMISLVQNVPGNN